MNDFIKNHRLGRPTRLAIFGIGCILMSCSSPPNDSSPKPSNDAPSADLGEKLRGAAQGAGVILVSAADGKYWLIPTLGIESVNGSKISLQPYYGSLVVATGSGYTPREMVETLQRALLQRALGTGGSHFIHNSGMSKHLSAEIFTPTEAVEVAVTAILSQCRFMGWGVDLQKVERQVECGANEVLHRDSDIDASETPPPSEEGGVRYYCCNFQSTP